MWWRWVVKWQNGCVCVRVLEKTESAFVHAEIALASDWVLQQWTP